jgi:hypothetical protein
VPLLEATDTIKRRFNNFQRKAEYEDLFPTIVTESAEVATDPGFSL